MSFGINPFALFIALLALWYTIRESRRNNSTLLRVCKCKGASRKSIDENNCQFFHYLQIVIRNEGIALHDVSVELSFFDQSGLGTLSFALSQKDGKASGPGEFAKGMISEFFLKSYQFDTRDLELLAKLKDPVKQRARLCVFSQGYLAKEFQIGNWWERLKLRWNGPASWFNARFERHTDRPGDVPIIKTYRIVPVFKTLLWPISCFARYIRQEYERVNKTLDQKP